MDSTDRQATTMLDPSESARGPLPIQVGRGKVMDFDLADRQD